MVVKLVFTNEKSTAGSNKFIKAFTGIVVVPELIVRTLLLYLEQPAMKTARFGNVNDFKKLLFTKTPDPRVVRELGRITEVNRLLSKALSPIVVRELGNFTEVNRLFAKALFPMVVTESEKVIDDKDPILLDPILLNALAGIFVTLFDKITVFKLVVLKN